MIRPERWRNSKMAQKKDTLILEPTKENIEKAARIIRQGGLVAFPTETVYGLGADAMNPDAVGRIYEAKGRPSDNPMIVHISRASDIGQLTRMLSPQIVEIIDNFWPGPLTLVLPKSDIIPDATTGGLDTVAIRMPSNETAYRLILAAGRPIAAPSANLSGKPSPTNAEDVLEDMDGRIDAVVMGEACDVGIESTVLDMTGDVPVVLRPGIITREWLSAVIGKEVRYDKSLLEEPAEIADPKDGVAETDFKPKSPGMKYKHYSPNAQVTLIEGNEDEFRSKATAFGMEARKKNQKIAVIDYGDDVRKAALNLFADLRELDRQGYDIILIRTLEQSGLGFSVMNRMLKSAGYDVIK